jgi:hypothetical protein
MIVSSFKADRDLLNGPLFGVGDAGFANYIKAFATRPFTLYLVNSIFAALVSVSITMVIGVCAAYAFSQLRSRWTEALWYAILASIMIPLEAIVIPLFLEVHFFGWQDAYAGIVIPTALNAAGIFILRQAITAIPEELFDASRMDGAPVASTETLPPPHRLPALLDRERHNREIQAMRDYVGPPRATKIGAFGDPFPRPVNVPVDVNATDQGAPPQLLGQCHDGQTRSSPPSSAPSKSPRRAAKLCAADRKAKCCTLVPNPNFP